MKSIQSEYRLYKIAKLNNKKYKRKVFDYVNKTFTVLNTFKNKNYNDYILFGRNKIDILFDYHISSKTIYIHFNLYHNIFVNIYRLDKNQIKDIFKFIVSKYFNLDIQYVIESFYTHRKDIWNSDDLILLS